MAFGTLNKNLFLKCFSLYCQVIPGVLDTVMSNLQTNKGLKSFKTQQKVSDAVFITLIQKF